MTTTHPAQIRDSREYTIAIRCEDGGSTTIAYIIDAGTETEQDEAAIREADARTDDWIRDGAWGDQGASVICWITMSDEDHEWPERQHTTEIAPNHDALIAAATRRHETCGTSPADHDWTREGEGGLGENPGVWATGGTSMTVASHCRCCGLRRTEYVTGSQRNPGECDTVRYEMASTDQIVAWRAAGDMAEAR